MEITLAIAIIGCVLSVASFAIGRKDKSNKDTKDDGYKWGQIDMRLTNIEKCLDKIEKKLDSLDKEVEDKIDLAIKNHIAIYHKKGE